MKILCFGDSNTYGYDPRGFMAGRYNAQSRWPDLLSARTGREVINAGICGQEIPRRYQQLPSFAEYDYILLMLGTNDLLQGASAREVTDRMEAFLQFLLPNCKCIVLVAPPPMALGAWVPGCQLVEASIQLGQTFLLLSQKLSIPFIDTREWRIPLAFDGVHFTEEGHRIFADQIANQLTDIWEEIP